ncbi:MAG: PIG-L family deacetylase [Armatimonadetes bacterium]|nr:PIG-L family deacetylase [Armatimonadota bacterium]
MKILGLFPHVDDNQQVCGGVIAQALAAGHSVKCVSTSNFHEPSMAPSMAALGVTDYEVWDFAWNELHAREDELRERVTALLKAYQPERVFTLWGHDTLADHVAFNRAALAGILVSEQRAVIYQGEIPSCTKGFVPNVYYAVSPIAYDLKMASLNGLTDFDDGPRQWWTSTCTAVMRARGLESGTQYAEAFVTYAPRALGVESL